MPASMLQVTAKTGHSTRVGLSVKCPDVAQSTAIGVACKELLEEARFSAVFVVDRKGRVVASVDDSGELAAGLAGLAARKAELHELLSGDEQSVLIPSGPRGGVQVSRIGRTALLGVVFSPQTIPDFAQRVRKATSTIELLLGRWGSAGRIPGRRLHPESTTGAPAPRPTGLPPLKH